MTKKQVGFCVWAGGSRLLDQHIVCVRECVVFLPGDTQREIKPREETRWRLRTALEGERQRERGREGEREGGGRGEMEGYKRNKDRDRC